MRSLLKTYFLTLVISSVLLFMAYKVFSESISFNLGLGTLIVVSFLILIVNITVAIKKYERLQQKLFLIFAMPTNYAFFLIIILLFLILNSEGSLDFSNFG